MQRSARGAQRKPLVEKSLSVVLVDVVRVAIAGREIRAQLLEVAVGRGDADGVWDNHGGGASSLKSLGEFETCGQFGRPRRGERHGGRF